jgi:predicted SnoaL-like aldol condensation-catalyzing enzyme
VKAVLKHFHDDAVFTSPVAKHIGFADDGVVNGKDALRRYWTAALAQNPDLHVQVTTVYQGENTLVIAYKNQNGIDRVEVLTFRQALVNEGHGAFAAG